MIRGTKPCLCSLAMFSEREEYDRSHNRATYSAANGAGTGLPLKNGYSTKPFDVIPWILYVVDAKASTKGS